MQDANPQATIERLATELAQLNEIKKPAWAFFTKTGPHKERVPMRTDWWHIRAASILRTIALKGPIGTEKLRIKYGGRQNRGVKPDKFRKSGGKIIRTILQQLEKAKLVKQTTVGVHKGRIATGAGYTILNRAATKKPPKPASPNQPVEATATAETTKQESKGPVTVKGPEVKA